MSKHSKYMRQHRTTVVTFREDGTKTTYRFADTTPSISRIHREAEQDAVVAWLMFPARVAYGDLVFFGTVGAGEAMVYPRSKTQMLISAVHATLGGGRRG